MERDKRSHLLSYGPTLPTFGFGIVDNLHGTPLGCPKNKSAVIKVIVTRCQRYNEMPKRSIGIIRWAWAAPMTKPEVYVAT